MGIDDSGRLVIDKCCLNILESFHMEVIPALQTDSKESDPISFFPTPADATWDGVCIRFLDGHTISASVGNVSGVYNFVQMGMSKKQGLRTKLL